MDRRIAFLLLLAIQLFSPGEAQFGAPPFGFGWYSPPNVSCSNIICGKGSCNSSYSSSGNSYSFSFSFSGSLCECKDGWGSVFRNSSFSYRPCVIPNCTLRECNSKLPELPRNPPQNTSDPCGWAYCGLGKCVTLSASSYRCDCDEGYRNLFNDSTFPCYNECIIGGEDCKAAGASFANATAESSAGGEGSGAVPAVPGRLLGLGLLLFSVAVAVVG